MRSITTLIVLLLTLDNAVNLANHPKVNDPLNGKLVSLGKTFGQSTISVTDKLRLLIIDYDIRNIPR